MNLTDFAKKISRLDTKALEDQGRICRGDILTMTTLAKSGHPGGSMSAIDLLLSIYAAADINKNNMTDPRRDRVTVSNGHISSAVYSCLAANSFIPREEAIAGFRKSGSLYEGHIERSVPGVEWTTGNLGQGLSAGCGMAVAGRVLEADFHVYVLMGDGEQEKGQIGEARRFAKKYGFNNITVIIDYNRLQISGGIEEVMPSLDIEAGFKADGWLVLNIDGHDFSDILGALLKARAADAPVMILAHTVMGKGVSFMENKRVYHGSALPEDKYAEAMRELGLEPRLDYYKTLREKNGKRNPASSIRNIPFKIDVGSPETYGADVKTDNRSAFGKALESLVEINNSEGNAPIVVFDCDLASSVKTSQVEKNFPENFFQCGIAEHHAAVCAGAASVNGAVAFLADFAMFGVDEVYNQQRLNGINAANAKIVVTHAGADVGEDGKTHMCVDYIGLMRNIFGFKIIVPADPNETDRAVRYAAAAEGNVLVAMGRSKLPVITDDKGQPFFAGNYEFRYGMPSIVRDGEYPLLSCGVMLHRALKVRELLLEKGISLKVINVSSPAHIDGQYMEDIFKSEKIFTYEDHIPFGGLFSTVAEISASMGAACKITPFGVTGFPCSGSPDEVFKILGIDPASVAEKIYKEVSLR